MPPHSLWLCEKPFMSLQLSGEILPIFAKKYSYERQNGKRIAHHPNANGFT